MLSPPQPSMQLTMASCALAWNTGDAMRSRSHTDKSCNDKCHESYSATCQMASRGQSFWEIRQRTWLAATSTCTLRLAAPGCDGWPRINSTRLAAAGEQLARAWSVRHAATATTTATATASARTPLKSPVARNRSSALDAPNVPHLNPCGFSCELLTTTRPSSMAQTSRAPVPRAWLPSATSRADDGTKRASKSV
jgi:hypothetical protein